MKTSKNQRLSPKSTTVVLDHNTYNYNIYSKNKSNKGTIVFPVFHYQGDNQYNDLLEELFNKEYRIITINLLNKGDRVLFFNYYYGVFKQFLSHLRHREILTPKDEITLMGIGVGANIVSYMNVINENVKRLVLISPINKYKGEYQINKEIAFFKIPTYIFYGQFDSLTNIDIRYSIFTKGKNNPNIHFTCYPCTDHYLYYNGPTSIDLTKMYKNNDIDLLVGDDRKGKSAFLPSGSKLNESFFNHLFNILSNKPNPKRICLLTDITPLFVNGVEMVVELLHKELTKLGYETYIACLWEKKTDLAQVPAGYIPVPATYAKFIKHYRDLKMLKNLNYVRNAKMLAMFGFDYLHLHTEYTMAQTALELSKMIGVKMPYTYHTLWKVYYEHQFGKLVGDITYKTAKSVLFKKIYKECPVIIVPSKKSYVSLKNEGNSTKDIRIAPSPINKEKFTLTKTDLKHVQSLRKDLGLANKKVIGYVGRVSTEKNITETIEFVSKIKDDIQNIMFVVVGTGDAFDALKKYVKKCHVEDNIMFLGQISNSDLKYYYHMFDAFVTASTFETQGLTYFEAAMCETPIVAKKDEAIEGVFTDGVNAYVYKDFKQWTDRIEEALFTDSKRIVTAAKETVKNYSQEKWAKNMLSIYKEINQK